MEDTDALIIEDVGDAAEDLSVSIIVDANHCVSGETQCVSESLYKECLNQNGAWVWSDAKSYGPFQKCVGLACQCDNECTLGTFHCVASSSDYQVCEKDPDLCYGLETKSCGTKFTCLADRQLCASEEFRVNKNPAQVYFLSNTVKKISEDRFVIGCRG